MKAPKRCYNNSIEVLVEHLSDPAAKTEYVEGIITEHGIPLAHAWNRENGEMKDHTVRDPPNHQYMGLIIPRKVLMRVATSDRFGKGYGDGVLGTIMSYKSEKKRKEFLDQIIEANA